MAYKFSTRSENNLVGVHPDLVRVVRRALLLSTVDFAVIEGLRTESRQKQLVAAGASKTLKSRHLTGHAIDVAPVIGGKISWDWPPYNEIAKAMDTAATLENVPVEWGGRWKTFKDGPHWQLPKKQYP